MMYRVLIIEDTPSEADTLISCLRRYEKEKGSSFTIDRLSSALEFMEGEHRADLVLMDIDLPGITGMEAAEHLRSYDTETPLIFVTNLAQYAVHGYAVDALDFIVKPVAYDDFALRMDRALRAMERNRKTTITLQTSDGLRIVPLASIEYVDILRHDLFYHLAGGAGALKRRGSIRQAAEQLGPEFVKVSSSCLANMGHIKLVRQESIVMSSNIELFFSRGCRKTALESIAAFIGRSI